jgi:hypothetical protein
MRRPVRGLAAAIALSLCAPLAHAQSPADAGWPVSEGLMTEYRKGNLPPLVAGAPEALKAEPWNKDLRLAYANSLTWSGKEWSAVEHYEMLLGTDLEVDARLGLANALAWTGRLSESLPHYKMLLEGKHAGEAKQGLANALPVDEARGPRAALVPAVARDLPDQEVGKEGLFYTLRATRPRTTLA